jgi:hypothetical protein
MRRGFVLGLVFCVSALGVFSQTNIICSNSTALQIMQGNYNPSAYTPAYIINDPDSIAFHLQNDISADSLRSIIQSLETYHSRNTGSDTVSNTNGIGAARRWAYNRFQQLSATTGNRLVPFYLQFDLSICGMGQHKNIAAVLPGMDTTDKSVIIVEAHIDSRCEVVCDTGCLAHGINDNGSGTALVLELARVMSQFALNRTVVFMLTTGEEQGLYGANAMALYTQQQHIAIKAVFNNDIVGGIFCGHTSSAPSCPGYGNLDSTDVRIFSYNVFNSPHKQLARFTKLEYKEKSLALAPVPMNIEIMTPEDRANRGGDHQPFREKNFTAIRFTSANEDGDAMIDTSYKDREHSVRDILSNDTVGGLIDSFSVDYNYAARNAVINGIGISMAGIGPETPAFTATGLSNNRVWVQIENENIYHQYRVGIRSLTNDWDSVYYMLGVTSDTLDLCDTGTYYVSVATMNFKNVESLFSGEVMIQLYDTTPCPLAGIAASGHTGKEIELLPNKPNPFDLATAISVLVRGDLQDHPAFISIADVNGQELKHLPIVLKNGINEVLYEHGFHASGIFFYTLFVDGKPVATRRMVFEN